MHRAILAAALWIDGGAAWAWTVDTGHLVDLPGAAVDVAIGDWNGRALIAATGPEGTWLVDPLLGRVVDRTARGASRVRIGDADGNERPDLFLCGREGGFVVHTAGAGLGSPLRDSAACAVPATPTYADLDGDGTREWLWLDADAVRFQLHDTDGAVALESRATAFAAGDFDGDGCPDLALVGDREAAVVLRRGVCAAVVEGPITVGDPGDLTGLGPMRPVVALQDLPPGVWRPRACAMTAGMAVTSARVDPSWDRPGDPTVWGASPAWGFGCEVGAPAVRLLVGVQTAPLLRWDTPGGRQVSWRLALEGGVAVGAERLSGFVVGYAGLGLLAVGGGAWWLPVRQGDMLHGARVQVDLIRAASPTGRATLAYEVRFGG